MDDTSLTFQTVSIRRMPGFEREGFKLEGLDPCINIVTGPNASGKTTTARALCLLLWPGEDHGWQTQQARLRGQLKLGDQQWTVECRQGNISYFQEGVKRERFPAPAEQTRDRYNLALHELIRDDDQKFAGKILRESAGGYDLEAAAKTLGYTNALRTRQVSQYRTYQESRGKLKEVQQEQEQLKQKQRHLNTRQRELQNAKKAQQRVLFLERAIAFKKAEKTLNDALAALKRFPDGIKKATGEEYSRLQDLNNELSEAQLQKEKANQQKKEVLEAVDRLQIPDEGLQPEVLDTLAQQVDALKELKREIEQRGKERAEYRGEAAQILREIDEQFSEEDLPTVDLGTIRQLDRFAQKIERLRGEEVAQQVTKNWLGKTSDASDTEKIASGLHYLQAWLREYRKLKTERSLPARESLAAAAVAAFSALGTYFVGEYGLLLLIGSGGLLTYGWMRSAKAKPSGGAAEWESGYEKIDLQQPEAWTEQAVEQLIDKLYKEYASAKLEEERKQRWQRLIESRENLELQQEQLAKQQAELRQQVGVVLDIEDDLPLAYFLRKVRSYQEKTRAMEGITQRMEHLNSRIEEEIVTINKTFQSVNYAEVSSVTAAGETVQTIEREHREWQTLQRDLKEAKQLITAAEETLTNKSAACSSIYKRLGVEEGCLENVKEIIDQVEAYEKAKQKRFSAQDRCDEALRLLKDHPLYAPEIKEGTIEELTDEQEACRLEAKPLDQLEKEIHHIQKRVEEYQNRHDLEKALAEKDRSLEGLEQLRAENLGDLVGDLLVDTIREKSRYQNRPAVFRKAGELFTLITGGRYELRLGGTDTPSFEAFDTRANEGQPLEALSSGTKIQLLLAVRMAFVESQEQTVKFPLFVDEVLANSDDIRARAIIDALVQICKEGRQIFYFTAQSDEVKKWRQILEAEEVSYSMQPLANTKSVVPVTYAGGDGVSLELVNRVSEPNGRSHAAYKDELNVPAFHPLIDPVERLHLWYLIEDTKLLHACLARGIDAWGPFKTYLTNGGQLSTGEADLLKAVQQKAEVLTQVLELYRQGRPQPVPPEALEQTDAVSDTFIEEVTALLQKVDGNPRKLVKGLQEGKVSRFLTRKIEELESYFEAEGYIDASEEIPPLELQAQVQAIASHYPLVSTKELQRLVDRVLSGGVHA